MRPSAILLAGSVLSILVWTTLESQWIPPWAERDPNKPMEALPNFKRSWEVGWTKDWTLKSMKEQEIDHFATGIVLTWERQEGKRRRIRTDAFTFDWKFYSGHEELYDGDKLIARGPINIMQDGRPVWRMMFYLGKVYPENPIKDEILEHQLEMFKGGDVMCTYRSRLNFGIDPKTLHLTRVPDDTRLIMGVGCPSVEDLRRGYMP